MSGEEYQRAELAALAEALQLEKEKQRIEARLLQLRQILASFRALRGDTNTTDYPMPKLTEAIRSTLAGLPATQHITAPGIRDILIRSGFQTNNYKNFLASIHSVLRRLSEQEVIEPVGDIAFGGGYKLRQPSINDFMITGLTPGDSKAERLRAKQGIAKFINKDSK